MPHLNLRFAPAALLVSLGILCTTSHAEIYRCKDESGQTQISDRPCGAATQGHMPRQNAAVGSPVDRLAAQEMVSGRSRDSSSQYDYIRDSSVRADRQFRK